MNEPVVDAQVVEEQSQELVPHQQPGTLFRTDDPVEVIERATRAANALRDVIVRKKLFKVIGDKAHVLVEGWTTLGSMLGVTPVKDWVRPLPWPEDEFLTDALRNARKKGLVFGYEASYSAQTLDGRRIGSAESVCKRTESKWANRDDYALESMAQTRATSRALRGPLGFVMQLAGYSATPAEEMGAEPDAA